MDYIYFKIYVTGNELYFTCEVFENSFSYRYFIIENHNCQCLVTLI